MKKIYLKPMTVNEEVELSQIIATSPTADSTPQIGGTSTGGEGLTDDRQDWGDLW